jgi:very-short-patch-repair endonuclease
MGETDSSIRMLIRHQWVREHGTPRVTTLVGSVQAGQALWNEWLQTSGRKAETRRYFEQPDGDATTWLDDAAAKAERLAVAAPREAIAIVVEDGVLAPWMQRRNDRLASFVAEGVVAVATRRARASRDAVAAAPRERLASRARSLAELTLFEALEATPSTSGRFALNESLSFQFGSRGAEVDLLSRQDDLVIEIDGYHHFADVEHYRRDRQKDLLLQAHGFIVLRFLAEDVLLDPRGAVQRVIELLGTRAARSRRRPPP